GGRAQSPGHRLAHLRIAGVGHVRVQVRLVALEHATRGGQHGRRRLDLRVAQREVEDLVGAALLLETRALLEHAADPRRPRQVLGHGPGDDHDRSIVDAAVRGASRRGVAVRAAGPPGGWGPRPEASNTNRPRRRRRAYIEESRWTSASGFPTAVTWPRPTSSGPRPCGPSSSATTPSRSAITWWCRTPT